MSKANEDMIPSTKHKITPLMIMPSKLLRLPSNGRTIFISCCIEESLLYLSAIDFSRNLMWKIVDSLYVVKSPIMCSSSDAILYEW